MAQASLEEDLNECHEIFASEVVRALNKFYSIPTNLVSMPNEVEYLSEDIYWGILTISFLLREKNHEVFKSLSKRLKNENYFYECCMIIPTERNDKFFFNFLKRVSRIYEMALFCYRNNANYIETARNCIAQFQDKEYFEAAGSWPRLDRIGSFLNCWSKRLRPVMLPQIHETPPEEEGRSEVLDKETTEGLLSDITFPVEREREHNSASVLLLADDCADIRELGSIEDEIKSILRYIKNFFPHRIVKCYKGLPAGPKSQNGSKENLQTSSAGPKTSSKRHEAANNAKGETANTKTETTALICERLADEMASSLTEKMSLKAKCEDLVRVIDETKACFADSSKSKLIPRSDSKEENRTRYSSILEDDLYLSTSSNDDNFERFTADKDCEEGKILSGEDLHQTSDESPSESSSDLALLAKREPLSADDAEYIKLLEHDLYVKAENFMYTSSSRSDSDSDCTEPYSAINSLADEGDASAANNDVSSPGTSSRMNIKYKNKSEATSINRPLCIPTGSSAGAPIAAEEDSDSSSDNQQLTKQASSEAAEKPNTSNAKPQQRKTKRRKKKGQKGVIP